MKVTITRFEGEGDKRLTDRDTFHVQLFQLLHVTEDDLLVVLFLRDRVAIESDLRQAVGVAKTGNVLETVMTKQHTYIVNPHLRSIR